MQSNSAVDPIERPTLRAIRFGGIFTKRQPTVSPIITEIERFAEEADEQCSHR